MNKTYKLLRAFIKASGYEIEEVQDQYSGEVIDYKVTKRVDDAQRRYNLYTSALMEYQSGATTLDQFTEITKGLL